MTPVSEITYPRDITRSCAHDASMWDDRAHFLEIDLSDVAKLAYFDGHAIYRVVSKAVPFSRLAGNCDTLYVGSGDHARIKSLSSTHSALRSIRHCERVRGEIGGTLVVQAHVTSATSDTLRSRLLESSLLAHIVRSHGEAPPCNLRWEGYPIGRALRAIADGIIGVESNRLRSYLFDWPKGSPRSTWIEYWNSGVWEHSFGWMWPSFENKSEASSRRSRIFCSNDIVYLSRHATPDGGEDLKAATEDLAISWGVEGLKNVNTVWRFGDVGIEALDPIAFEVDATTTAAPNALLAVGRICTAIENARATATSVADRVSAFHHSLIDITSRDGFAQ